MNTRIQTCFITAPAGSNLDILVGALRRRDIGVLAPKDLALGRDIASGITDLLSDADLVIGVMTRDRRSEWALFELGIAWGLGKRVLLFAPPNSSHLPSTLRRFVTVRANITNREAVEFALDQLMAAPESSHTAAVPGKRTRPLGGSADAYLRGSMDLATTLQGSELEQLVANALTEVGVDVVAAAPTKDQGADLAIWSDALQATVGNPFLIELKTRLPAQNVTVEAAWRLARHVAAAGGAWGLLLYGSGPDKPKGLPPNILALPIRTLFERLRTQSFDEVIRDLRNRRVHGSDPT